MKTDFSLFIWPFSGKKKKVQPLPSTVEAILTAKLLLHLPVPSTRIPRKVCDVPSNSGYCTSHHHVVNHFHQQASAWHSSLQLPTVLLPNYPDLIPAPSDGLASGHRHCRAPRRRAGLKHSVVLSFGIPFLPRSPQPESTPAMSTAQGHSCMCMDSGLQQLRPGCAPHLWVPLTPQLCSSSDSLLAHRTLYL